MELVGRLAASLQNATHLNLQSEVDLVSAILRTITQVLDSKAAFEPTFETQAAEEESFENPVLLGQNVFEGVKLSVNMDDGDEATNTQSRNEIKVNLRNKLQNLTPIKNDNIKKEPGEISSKYSDDGHSKKEEVVTETPGENKAEKERVLSAAEQNHIISCIEKSVQLFSHLAESTNQILSCQFCSFSTRGEKQQRDLRIHHESFHFICTLCGNELVSKSDLKVHLEKTHTEGSKFFVCGIGGCEQKEKINLKNGERVKFQSLYTHIRKRHCTFKYSCDICKMQVRTASFLRDHISTEHTALTATSCKCPHCNKEVKYASNLQAHINATHTIRPHLKCPSCDFMTQTISKMKRHVKVVHLWEPLKRSSYEFETMNPETVKKHKERQRSKKLLCRFCNYKGKKTDNLRRHELTHSDVAGYICDKCDFRTKTPQSLKVHSLYHEDAPKYICDQCEYKSFNSANLWTHKKTKHGTTQYKCDECGEIFQYMRHLLRHQDNHQTFKFNCEKCEKVFSRKDRLREHGREVHDEIEVKANTKSVACPQCGKIFTQNKHLSRHKASAHGGFVFNCVHCKKNLFKKRQVEDTLELQLQRETLKHGLQCPEFI